MHEHMHNYMDVFNLVQINFVAGPFFVLSVFYFFGFHERVGFSPKWAGCNLDQGRRSGTANS